jgi:hypothetical protein
MLPTASLLVRRRSGSHTASGKRSWPSRTSPAGVPQQADQHRHHGQRQHQRAEQREDHRQRHRPEQLPLHALQCQDGEIDDHDNQLTEHGRLPYLEDGVADDGGPARAGVGVVGQAAHDVFDQDDGAVHDQAEVEGAEAEQAGGDAEAEHPAEGEQLGVDVEVDVQLADVGDDEKGLGIIQVNDIARSGGAVHDDAVERGRDRQEVGREGLRVVLADDGRGQPQQPQLADRLFVGQLLERRQRDRQAEVEQRLPHGAGRPRRQADVQRRLVVHHAVGDDVTAERLHRRRLRFQAGLLRRFRRGELDPPRARPRAAVGRGCHHTGGRLGRFLLRRARRAPEAGERRQGPVVARPPGREADEQGQRQHGRDTARDPAGEPGQ